MLVARVAHEGAVFYARVEGDRFFRLTGDIFGAAGGTEGFGLKREEIRILPPVVPSKTVCVGRNYVGHAKELGNEIPSRPLLFIKPPSALCAHEDGIIYPALSNLVHYEGEIAVIIKDRFVAASPDEAGRHILGITCANDVTARDIQRLDGQFVPAKCFDTFLPLGPYIHIGVRYDDIRLTTRLNGQVVQDDRTSGMIFPINDLVSFISHRMTLQPGDVILTGTPEGVGELHPGDSIEVEVESVGTLCNRVVRA